MKVIYRITFVIVLLLAMTGMVQAKPINTYADGALVPLKEQKVCWKLKREANEQGLVGKTLRNKRYKYHHRCGWMIVTGKFLANWGGKYNPKQYGNVFSSPKAKHNFYKKLHKAKKAKKLGKTKQASTKEAIVFFKKAKKHNRKVSQQVINNNVTRFIKEVNTK